MRTLFSLILDPVFHIILFCVIALIGMDAYISTSGF